MPCLVCGPIEVDAEGATWVFGEPQTAFDLIGAMVIETEKQDDIDEDLLRKQARALIVAFDEACIGWRGVQLLNGDELPYSAANLKLIPPNVKAAAVVAWLQRRGELLGKSNAPGTQPISSTGQGVS